MAQPIWELVKPVEDVIRDLETLKADAKTADIVNEAIACIQRVHMANFNLQERLSVDPAAHVVVVGIKPDGGVTLFQNGKETRGVKNVTLTGSGYAYEISFAARAQREERTMGKALMERRIGGSLDGVEQAASPMELGSKVAAYDERVG